MSKATAVLKPGEPVTLPPAGNISFEIEKGQRFKLTQPRGRAGRRPVSFNRDDPREILSMLTQPRRQPELQVHRADDALFQSARARCGRSRRT